MNESDLGPPIIDFLESKGYECFQEVIRDGRAADIVGRHRSTQSIWVVELKTSLSLAVMEQAWRWIGLARRISIATPKPKWNKSTEFVDDILDHYGIGRMEVKINGYVAAHEPDANRADEVSEVLRSFGHPALLNWNLTEAHKNNVAGTPGCIWKPGSLTSDAKHGTT